MKKCSRCNQEKRDSDFYKDRRTPSGLKCQCKKCHSLTSIATRDPEKTRDRNRDYMRRARERNPIKFREREVAYSRKRKLNDNMRARYRLNRAIISGVVVKPHACSRCGRNLKLNAHHSDYSRPLDVVWLCTECHGIEHRRIHPAPHLNERQAEVV